MWVFGGLPQVLTGADPVPAWWGSRWRRWTALALAALGVAMLALSLLAVARVLTVERFGAPVVRPRPLHPGVLLVPALLAPLPLAVRFPLLAWRIAYLIALLAPLLPGQPRVHPVQATVLLVVTCAAGLRHPRPLRWWLWALLLLPVWLWAGPGWAGRAELTAGLALLAAAVDGVGSWRYATRALAAQQERAELERARRAVLEERTRIARELHDVVAHHLSLIAVQAETAPYRQHDLPEPVRAEFSSLSGAAREALVEMRKLLGVLRHDQPAERAPQPRLGELPELVAAARRAGVAVELSMPAAGGQLPPGVAVCAYRIVQEALSNASRHAPGAPVAVTVDRDDRALRLRVANGRGDPPWPSPDGRGPGHGLAGMRERVALLGGSLEAGHAPGGGFAVAAVLPLDGGP